MHWFPRLPSHLSFHCEPVPLVVVLRCRRAGAGEWTTFGNGPGHAGFYPKTDRHRALSSPAGRNRFQRFSIQSRSRAIPSTATTNAYFSPDTRAFALRVADGSEKWSFPLAEAYLVNPPSSANGRVCFLRDGNSSDTRLWCLEAAGGTPLWAAPTGGARERWDPCTMVDGAVFLGTRGGGSFGGLYGIEASTGVRRLFNGSGGTTPHTRMGPFTNVRTAYSPPTIQ
jgi:outer membrane protein assembly factor BamB